MSEQALTIRSIPPVLNSLSTHHYQLTINEYPSTIQSRFAHYSMAGVIDADYTGNIGVILFNHTDQDFEVSVTIHSLLVLARYRYQ